MVRFVFRNLIGYVLRKKPVVLYMKCGKNGGMETCLDIPDSSTVSLDCGSGSCSPKGMHPKGRCKA